MSSSKSVFPFLSKQHNNLRTSPKLMYFSIQSPLSEALSQPGLVLLPREAASDGSKVLTFQGP
jgi:hypothetical protein